MGLDRRQAVAVGAMAVFPPGFFRPMVEPALGRMLPVVTAAERVGVDRDRDVELEIALCRRLRPLAGRVQPAELNCPRQPTQLLRERPV
jgi:hypothetical protein